MTAKIDFDIFARDRASGPIRNVGDTATRSSGGLRRFGSSLASVAGGIGLYSGLRSLTRGLVDSGKAALEDEQSQKLLAQQMRNSADASHAQIDGMEQWIITAGTAYGVTDDELRPALSRLVAATGDVGEAQADTRLAMDVAAGARKSLTQVTTALARAETGSLTGLGKLGVATKDQAGKALTLDQITKNLARTYEGSAAKAASTAQGRWDRLGVILDETKETIGSKLIPVALDLSEVLLNDIVPGAMKAGAAFSDEVGPTLREVYDALREVAPEAKDLAVTFGREVLPVLGDVVHVGAEVISFVDGLPGPIKSAALQAGIAAMVFPRLAAGVAMAGTSMRNGVTYARVLNLELRDQTTRAGVASAAVGKLGGAAKTAAGVGGMLALAQGASTGNEAVGTLLSTMGGAATGFAIGGPIGAAVGALGGLVTGLAQSREETEKATTSWGDYASALDQATGAITQQTKATTYDNLQKSGAFDAATKLGLSQSQLTSAVLGRARAQGVLVSALDREKSSIAGLQAEQAKLAEQEKEASRTSGQRTGRNPVFAVQQAELAKEIEARKKVIDLLEGEAGAAARGRQEIAKKLAVTSKIPRSVTTTIQTEGIPKTARDIADLTQRFRLTPKQVRTVIQTTNVDASVKDVQRVIDKITAAGRVRGDLPGFTAGVQKSIRVAEQAAGQGGTSVGKKLRDGTAQARPDFGGFRASLGSQIGAMQGQAGAGGQGIGGSLGDGVIGGLASRKAAIVSLGATVVIQAIQAARNAAESKSPSKKMIALGKDLGLGGELGLKKSAPGMKREMVKSITETLKAGKQKIASSRKELADQLAELGSGLQARREEIAAGVQARRDELAGVEGQRNDFASGFQSFGGSIFDVEAPTGRGAKKLTAETMLSFQTAQLAKSQQAATAVQTLVGKGLSGSLIKELQAKGAGGFDQLIALAEGSMDQIARANANAAAQSSALQAAGMVASNVAFAGELAAAQSALTGELASSQVALAQAIGAAVAQELALRQAEQKVEFEIRGDVMAGVLKKRERKTGNKPNRGKGK